MMLSKGIEHAEALCNALIAILFFVPISHALTVEEISSHGVYLRGHDGFVPAAPLTNDGIHYDFSNKLLSFPHADVGSGALEVVLFNEGLTIAPGAIVTELRSFMSPARGQALVADNVTPIGEHKYLLTFSSKNITPNSFLVFDTICCVRHVFGIALREPRQGILETFANSTKHNPVTAESIVGKVAASAPEDRQLQQLKQYWSDQIEHQKSAVHFAQVKEAWARYEGESETSERVRALKHVRSLADDYLSKYPKGAETSNVKRLLSMATKKLDI